MGNRRRLTAAWRVGVALHQAHFLSAMLAGDPAGFDMTPSLEHRHTALDVHFFPDFADIHW
ncbi:hypothetical protein [Burkholderia cenocepacia]|uniref:hypothetical protein n=1 Tax=Burkholderia cenocepacia TaxID=95486 RepID=UPI000F59D44E|nr:hypothetical protein [Burkholderia cenocepacia]